MNNFETLIRKNLRTVIGVLSGTSVDAVDIVLVKIKGKGKSSEIKVLDFRSYPINIKLKKHILRLSTDNKIKAEDICRLNFVIGNLFAESVNKFISDKNLSNMLKSVGINQRPLLITIDEEGNVTKTVTSWLELM